MFSTVTFRKVSQEGRAVRATSKLLCTAPPEQLRTVLKASLTQPHQSSQEQFWRLLWWVPSVVCSHLYSFTHGHTPFHTCTPHCSANLIPFLFYFSSSSSFSFLFFFSMCHLTSGWLRSVCLFILVFFVLGRILLLSPVWNLLYTLRLDSNLWPFLPQYLSTEICTTKTCSRFYFKGLIDNSMFYPLLKQKRN